MEGVRAVSISLEEKQATITYDESLCSPSDLKKAVEEAGYNLHTERANE